MTNRTYLTYSGTQNPSQPSLKSKIKSLKIKSHDLPFIGICVSTFTYFTINYPLFIATLGCASVVFLSLWHITQVVPLLEKWLHGKIRFWHLTSLILAVTAVLSLFDTPAQALFLSGLEEFFKQLAQGAQASGSGQTISNEVIELIFNLIRGAFLLLVAAASLFAYNQAQQGNDWRPIITQVGLSFAIVIAVDVVTFLFIGNQSA